MSISTVGNHKVTLTGCRWIGSEKDPAITGLCLTGVTDAGESDEGVLWFTAKSTTWHGKQMTGAQKSLETLKEIGVDVSNPAQVQIAGKVATFVVQEEFDQSTGERRMRVAFVNGPPRELDPADAAAKLRALGIPVTASKPAAVPPTTTPPAAADDF